MEIPIKFSRVYYYLISGSPFRLASEGSNPTSQEWGRCRFPAYSDFVEEPHNIVLS